MALWLIAKNGATLHACELVGGVWHAACGRRIKRGVRSVGPRCPACDEVTSGLDEAVLRVVRILGTATHRAIVEGLDRGRPYQETSALVTRALQRLEHAGRIVRDSDARPITYHLTGE